MNDVLATLNFSETDILMLLLCPCFSAIGGLLHVLMSSCDLTRWPTIRLSADVDLSSGDWKSKAIELTVFAFKRVLMAPVVLIHAPYWILARLALSLLTGLIVGLYFVGVFPDSPGGIARIFALSVFIGYVSPILWLAKEKWVLSVVESETFKIELSKAVTQAYENSKATEEKSGKTP